MTKTGPKVLEYNVRFGDPETQTLLSLLSQDSDLAEIMLACTCGRLRWVNLKVDSLYAVTVVIAAGGYPGPCIKGSEMMLDPVDSGMDKRLESEVQAADAIRYHNIPRRHNFRQGKAQDVRWSSHCCNSQSSNIGRRSGKGIQRSKKHTF
jgi:phosphoribosylamine-glycine ligase